MYALRSCSFIAVKHSNVKQPATLRHDDGYLFVVDTAYLVGVHPVGGLAWVERQLKVVPPVNLLFFVDEVHVFGLYPRTNSFVGSVMYLLCCPRLVA